ncbi:MMPL family transporter [Streptomyces sp. NPDC089919]|uniref:MMPL family transporter n=1 Tax=Streptomyces sp. NPDC089919 TaxID=3155188 RepID=UPI003442A265
MRTRGRHVRTGGRHVRAALPAGRSLLNRWGVAVARHRSVVLCTWLLVLLGSAAVYPSLESRLGAPDNAVHGSGSAAAEKLVAAHFPALGTEQDAVVFRSRQLRADSEPYRRQVTAVLERLGREPGVTGIASPYDSRQGGRTSRDGRAAVAVLGVTGNPAARARLADRLREVAADASREVWLETHIVGPSPLNNDLARVQLRDQRVSEAIGIPIALLILLLALRSVLAAVLPVAIALGSILFCLGLLTALAEPLRLDTFAMVITTMIGAGVGIDYSLFVVSRFREEAAHRIRRDGGRLRPEAVQEAVGVAVQTSGGTVVASGLIVIVSLGSMAVVDSHVFVEVAAAAGLVVTCCIVTGLTLLPAALAALAPRLVVVRARRRRSADGPAAPHGSGRWAAWAGFVIRRPLRVGLPVFLLLGLLAIPVTAIRLGSDMGLDALDEGSSRRGQQIVAQSFAPGLVAPVTIVGCAPRGRLNGADLGAFEGLTASLRGADGVADVLAPERRPGEPTATVNTSADGRCAQIRVVTARPVDSPAARTLVTTIREESVPRFFADSPVPVKVGGFTAEHIDLSAETGSKLPVVVLIICGLSLCYLAVIFRSLFLPLKAVLLNLLATTAALGLTVVVFQLGHGARLVGFTPVGTLQSLLPVVLFTLLFGLSMDYEVFLIRRVREEWLSTGDNDRAIVVGLSRTAREITAGAMIMAAVFGSFLSAQSPPLKQFGFSLAVAVLLDSTIVRMVLVPALLSVGAAVNWWLPFTGRRRTVRPRPVPARARATGLPRPRPAPAMEPSGAAGRY